MMRRRHQDDGSNKNGGGAGARAGAAALCLLLPFLALIVLDTDFLPQLAPYWTIGSPAESRDKLTNNSAAAAATRDEAAPISSKLLSCNFSSFRTDTCTMEGDVRINGKSASVYIVSSSTDEPAENSPIKLRPHPRKWEEYAMSLVREVTIIRSSPAGAPPPCGVRHDVPAVVFSTGGYNWNMFHVMGDIVIPLYLTAHHYNGRVQLLATDYDPKVVTKYRAIFAALSIYPVVDLDADGTVRCFPSAHVGLESHGELSIHPGVSRYGNYSMVTFGDFMRAAYSLRRPWVTPRSSGDNNDKPRLVMLLRRHARALTNEAGAVAAVKDAGFEVVAAASEDVTDLERFAAVVNSCDVMLGVHGSGLTNMFFLPRNATVAHIIPWGELKWACRNSFGHQVPAMGLRYAEYEATADESTLGERYPKDHAVFTDPLSIHRQGYDKVLKIFINGQNVTLDLHRFRGFVKQLYQSVTGRE